MRTTAEKKSLLLYYDYKSHFDFLTDEQVGKIIKAMLSYEIDGVFPEFDEPILKMTFSFIKSNLDRDKQKYLEKCENLAKIRVMSKSKSQMNSMRNKPLLKVLNTLHQKMTKRRQKKLNFVQKSKGMECEKITENNRTVF